MQNSQQLLLAIATLRNSEKYYLTLHGNTKRYSPGGFNRCR
jgi:hypothetical protein